MDAYLGVTCHDVSASLDLATKLVLRAGSQDLERSAVGRPNAEVCAAGVKKTSEVKDLSSRVDGRPVFVPPRATISSDGKKALKQLREKPSRQRSEYKTQKALHGIYRGIACLVIRREAEARYTRLLGDSTPQEPIQPGDYVWVKKFVRKRWNTPRWEGPHQVQLTTKTAVRVDGKLSWIHLSHCKKQKILPGEGEGAVADSPRCATGDCNICRLGLLMRVRLNVSQDDVLYALKAD
ncbi:hypothetical protein D4764_07G0011210 [Takifugu flavidus]|uniref:Murine leukemia virus integrase C-terminal domain-containing protein n=1 Tax=Takifugu flavidus TaxID=433684 RepID=A0A5C6MT43_9TELE|nr:hypothetical protein D4764_07G0011210 [Takifugu flavidus]